MPTSYTTLLGLALPVTGELSGTWGTTVNDYITQYLDASIAGTQTISGSQTAVTLSKTENASLSQAGSGATGSSQYAVINCTGNPASLLTVTVPAASKEYIVVNATSTNQSVKIVGAGPTTGVTVVAGERCLIAWNGSDFVKIGGTNGAGTFTSLSVSGTTTLSGLTASTALALNASKEVVSVTNTGTGNNVLANSPTLTGTVGAAAATLSGNLTLNGGTANGVSYLNASKVLTTGSALTFDGTNFATTGTVTSAGSNNSGNLAFTGTGNRITGDFSNATVANKVFFQTSTANSPTTVSAAPSGTSTTSYFDAWALSSGFTNGSYARFGTDGAGVSIESNRIGTGAYLPMLFVTGGSERVRIDTSGNVGIGQSYGLTNSRLVISGQSAGSNGAYATGVGSIVLNETGRTSINDIGGLEFKTSVFGNGYGAKIIALDAGTLVFGNRDNSATFTERARITSGGDLLVGKTSTSLGTGFQFSNATGNAYAEIGKHSSSVSGDTFLFFTRGGTALGSVTQNGTTAVLYNTSSDYRLKNITGPITTSGAYIDSLNPVEGTWKSDGSPFVGLIAHEVQEVSRTQVATGVKDGEQMQAMDYSASEIIANLIAEVKSLRARVAQLESK